MRRPRILIVDDDPSIVKFVCDNLKAEKYDTLTSMNGAKALQVIERELLDLVILDIMLPGTDGFEVCRKIREWSQIPIIMLSALGNEEDKIKCLDVGADDYITKPFGIHELMARVRAVLRRAQKITPPTQPPFICGDLEVDFVNRRVTIVGNEVKLTPTEFSLLRELVLNAGKVLTHAYLLNKVWGPEYRSEREYLHVFIRRLRKELEQNPDNPKHILTIPKVGYQFKL
jgi:two-component system KDP operon response regulator KdpE